VLSTQLIIIAISLFVWSIDQRNSVLLEMFHLEKHPRAAYYLVGLFLFLAAVGMFASVQYCMRSNGQQCSCGSCAPCYCCDDLFFYNPYIYVASDTGGTPCTCCCGSCGECGGQGCAGCTECGGCHGCATASLGEEAFLFVVVIVVIFAVVGVFVCIVMGTMFLQFVVERHLRVLRKFSLTKDYEVADLADSYLSLSTSSNHHVILATEVSAQDHIEMGSSQMRGGSEMTGGEDTSPSAPPLGESPSLLTRQQEEDLMRWGLLSR